MTEELKQVGGEAETVAETEATNGAAAQTVESAAVGGSGGSDAVVGQAARLIAPPPSGQTEVVRLAPGERFELAANPASVNLVVDGNDLVLGFDLDGDGAPDSFVVLEDLVLAAGSGNPPVLMVAGEPIGIDLLIGNAQALAQTDQGGPGTPLETAAGEAGPQGTGATQYSDNLGDAIDLLVAQGVIPPVQLEFGLIELQDEPPLLLEEDSPPEADPVLTPASLADGGEGGALPPDLVDALNTLGIGGSGEVPANWNTLGSVTTTNATFGIAPDEGSAQLTMQASGATQGEIETFFGLAAGTLDGLDGIDDATDGSAVKTVFSVLAGDQISIQFNFLDLEQYDGSESFNDFAFIYIDGFGAIKLADVLSTNSAQIETDFGTVSVTGYNEVTITFGVAGDYTVGFGVMNEGDTAVDSGLLIDNVVHTSGETETVTGFEGGGSDVVFYKQLIVDGSIGDDDSGVIADFGGADAETPLESLVFTLLSPPTFGQLILVSSGGTTSFLNPGDTFTSADTVWWIATEEQIADFLSQPGAPEFLPDVNFDYSVTDEAGNVATAPVTITLPPPNEPRAALGVFQDTCLNEDAEGALFFSASPTDGASKISQIVISGFPIGEAADAWVVDASSVNVFGYTFGVDYTTSYDPDTGELTITFTTANFSLGEAVDGTVNVTPNPDSDVDQSLTIEATAINGAGSATDFEDSVIPVDADADGAEGSAGDDGDGVHLSVVATASDSNDDGDSFQPDEIGTLNIQATFDDFLDGSETHTIQVFAPDGFTILAIDEEGLPEGVTLVSNDGSIAIFDVETLDGLGSVNFDIPIQNTGAEDGEDDFLVRALAEETNTGDIECVDGGEGGLYPIEGDNVAFVEDEAGVVIADVAAPEVSLSLYGDDTCIEEDSLVSDFNNQVTLTVDPDGDDLLTEIVITGLQANWTYDFSGLGGAGITVDDSVPGQVTITFDTPSNATYNGTFGVQPPADSDVDHPTITATASVMDPVDNALTDSGDTTLDIHVDANADAGPGAVGGTDDLDGDFLSISIDDISDSNDAGDSFQVGESGTLTVTATFDDFLDGSETHQFTVTAPDGFTIDGINAADLPLPSGVTFDLAVDGGSITFSMPTDSVDGLESLTVTLDITNVSAAEGSPTFEASATATETLTDDEECDDSDGDNIATVSDEQSVTLAAVAPPVVALTLPDQVDCIEEDSLADDTSNLVTLTVTPDGDDEITEIVITGLQSDWTYDFSGLEVLGATLTDSDPSDGSITLSVPNLSAYTGTFGVQPPADSDVDHPTITATATVVDGVDPALSDSGNGTLDIHVDANADAVTADITVSDSGDAGTNFVEGETGSVTVNATFGDFEDESETHTVTVTIPTGFSYDALSISGYPTGTTVDTSDPTEIVFTVPTDAANGTGSFTATFDVTNNSAGDGDHTFAVEAKAVETTTDDEECDTSDTDNIAVYGDEDTATVLDDTPSFEAGTILVHDESDGLQSAVDDDANGTDEDDIDPTIGTLPTGLQDVLTDLSIVQGDVVGVAQDTIAFSYGQNGPAASDAVVLSLTAQGQQSTLFAANDSEGDGSKRPIYLYQISAGVIVGVLAEWDGDSWENPDTLNDAAVTANGDYVEIDESLATVAFIVYMDDPAAPAGVDNDSSADVYFVQNVAIWNDDSDDHDESDGSIAFEDQSVSVVVTDVDNDSVTGNFVIRVEDDGPVLQDANASGTVEEEHLSGGNEDDTGTGDADVDPSFDNTTTVATGSLSGLVSFGTDGPGSFALNAIPNSTPVNSGLTSGGATVWYVSDGTTLTAFVDEGDGDFGAGDTTIFTLALSGTNNEDWTFTLLGVLDHAADDAEDILTIDFSGLVTATDGDGDSVTLASSTFTVDVIDDIPENISPDAAVLGSNGSFPVSVTEDLDFFDNLGADKPGDVVFDPNLDGDTLTEDDGVTPVTSNGFAIILAVSGDGHTLTGWADVDGDSIIGGDDTQVFTIVLNPDATNEGTDEYTFTLLDKLDTGAALVFENFEDVDAGGPKEFIGLDDPRTGANDLGEDIIFTASPESGLVNASAVGIGVGSQNVDTGETIRIDFVKDVVGLTDVSPGVKDDFTNLTYSGHYTVNDTGFTVSQVIGGTSTINVKALDADDDKDFGGDGDDVQRSITRITVLNASGIVIIDDVTVDTTVGSVSVDFKIDGTVDISGLDDDYQVFVSTASGFDALEITCLSAKFDLGGVTTSAIQAGEPIDMDFDVIAEDEDGDTSTGTIEVTVLPQVEGTAGDDLLTANANGNDLVGDDGNDTLVGSDADDKLQGGNGIDTISDGDGNDIIIGGNGADVINLAADGDTDIIVYDDISEAGDVVSGFDADDPATGGDVIDLVDLLDGGTFTGTTLSEAIAGGYLNLDDSGTDLLVQVDLDGASGGTSFTTVVTITGIGAGNEALVTDNIMVD